MENPTIEETRKLQHFDLDWLVTKDPIRSRLKATGNRQVPGVVDRVIDNHFALYRSDQSYGQPLGIVGSVYEVYQNFQHLRHAADLMGGLEKIDNGGFFSRGKRIYLQATLSEDGIGRGNHREPVATRFTAMSGHGGGNATRYGFNRTVIVCVNTAQMAWRELGGVQTVQHSRYQTKILSGIIESYAEEMVANRKDLEMYQHWAEQPVSPKQVGDFVNDLFPSREKILEEIDPLTDLNKKVEIIPRAREKLLDVYESGRGMDSRDHTWWRVFNAVTEYIDHHRKGSESSRLESSWTGAGAKLRQQAVRLILSAS